MSHREPSLGWWSVQYGARTHSQKNRNIDKDGKAYDARKHDGAKK